MFGHKSDDFHSFSFIARQRCLRPPADAAAAAAAASQQPVSYQARAASDGEPPAGHTEEIFGTRLAECVTTAQLAAMVGCGVLWLATSSPWRRRRPAVRRKED